MVVNAIYNMIDQVLIGWSDVGMLGIGATTVSFPLTTIMTALSLLFSVGCAAGFNLNLGKGDNAKAGRIAGTAISLGVIAGTALLVVSLLFLRPMLVLFGATEAIMPYAVDYTRIIIFGIPFGILSTIFSSLIRADGNPRYSMICMLSGAAFNLVFDPMVLFVFKLGLKGIAFTTSFGMVITAVMGAAYLLKSFRAVKLARDFFRIRFEEAKTTLSLGLGAMFNQAAMTVMQIVMNNTLRVYGENSAYGNDAIISCVGSINKLNMIFISVVVGVGQGCQPIIGFNYGAKQYDRVKKTYRTSMIIALTASLAVFLVYQLLPRQLLSFYGNNPDAFFDFGTLFLRIFMLMTFLNCVQPITASFLTSIGKAQKGLFIAMTRQVIFLIPLLILLPRFFGLEGILFAGPVSDFAAAATGIVLAFSEMKNMTKLQQ